MKWYRELNVRVTQASNQCRLQLANYSKCGWQIYTTGQYACQKLEVENVRVMAIEHFGGNWPKRPHTPWKI